MARSADNKPKIEILSVSFVEAQFLELFNLTASRCVLLAAGKAQSGFLNSDAFLFSTYRDSSGKQSVQTLKCSGNWYI